MMIKIIMVIAAIEWPFYQVQPYLVGKENIQTTTSVNLFVLRCP